MKWRMKWLLSVPCDEIQTGSSVITFRYYDYHRSLTLFFFAMNAKNAWESFQLRARVPLELFCFIALLLAFCSPAIMTIPVPPYEMCGRVYSKPPARLYFAVIIVCGLIFVWKLMEVFERSIFSFSPKYHAVLVPTVRYGRGATSASYAHRWRTVLTLLYYPTIVVFLCSFFSWVLGSRFQATWRLGASPARRRSTFCSALPMPPSLGNSELFGKRPSRMYSLFSSPTASTANPTSKVQNRMWLRQMPQMLRKLSIAKHQVLFST